MVLQEFRRVVVIDDDASLRSILEELLEPKRYNVEAASKDGTALGSIE